MLQRTPVGDMSRARHADHQRLFRMVEGAVMDAFQAHPTYLTRYGQRNAVRSITKRVVGTLVGHANEARKGGPLGGCSVEAGVTPANALTDLRRSVGAEVDSPLPPTFFGRIMQRWKRS